MSSILEQKLKDRYRVVESLGRGGMAEVYKVWDEERLTYLALKLLRDDLAQDVVFMRRFQREARNLAQLQHPNIVRFFGLEEDDLKAFILMEYIEGLSLREQIRRAGSAGIPLGELKALLGNICAALNYAHGLGVVHCDIKPGNVLLDRLGTAYLTDFGIARTLDAATSTMIGVGTPAYMAPEVVMGNDPTIQSDIYALGIMLFEMLTGGERPFTGEHAQTTGTTAEKMRWEQMHMPPPSIRAINTTAPKAMDEVIGICLQKDPQKRFARVVDVYHAVEALLEKMPESKAKKENILPDQEDIEPNRPLTDVVVEKLSVSSAKKPAITLPEDEQTTRISSKKASEDNVEEKKEANFTLEDLDENGEFMADEEEKESIKDEDVLWTQDQKIGLFLVGVLFLAIFIVPLCGYM